MSNRFNNILNKTKFYWNNYVTKLLIFIYEDIKFLFLNLYLIIINPKKITLFVTLLPMFNIFIIFIIIFVFSQMILYTLKFILYKKLLVYNNIKVKIPDINTSALYIHSIYRTLYLLPKSIRFYFFL